MSHAQGATPPITMALMGGLGNQLFQFATGLEVAARANTSLALDLRWFGQSRRRKRNGLELRSFELDRVAHGIRLIAPPSSALRETAGHARDVLLRRLPRMKRGPLSRFVYQRGGSFDSTVLEARPGTHLSGYFASWRYFPTVADSVRSRVRQAAPDTDWLQVMSTLAVNETPIGLHVRRGDYLALSGIYGHVTPSYYLRALNVLRSMGQFGPVWLFSDEPDAALEWLKPQVRPDRVVLPPVGSHSLESMLLMSMMRALVIANSTYSWWAAFIGETQGRPVVAPRPTWASDAHEEPRDALLPGWLTLDCRDFS